MADLLAEEGTCRFADERDFIKKFLLGLNIGPLSVIDGFEEGVVADRGVAVVGGDDITRGEGLGDDGEDLCEEQAPNNTHWDRHFDITMMGMFMTIIINVMIMRRRMNDKLGQCAATHRKQLHDDEQRNTEDCTRLSSPELDRTFVGLSKRLGHLGRQLLHWV